MSSTKVYLSLAFLGLGLAGCATQQNQPEEQQTETTVTEKTLLPSALITRRIAIPQPQQIVLDASDNFAVNSAQLSARGKAQLDKALLNFSLADMRSIQVTGHTDSMGSDSYNDELSKRRADAVKTYLTERGVPARLISTQGLGERQPVATNNTAAGRAQNRRVEISFTAES